MVSSLLLSFAPNLLNMIGGTAATAAARPNQRLAAARLLGAPGPPRRLPAALARAKAASVVVATLRTSASLMR